MNAQRPLDLAWDDLRYVLALARHRTLSAAADVLGVTHTTVGRRLRRLEDELDSRLFDRTPDGLVSTVAGSDLVATAERVEREVHSVERRLLGRDSRLAGPLRVATMEMLFLRFQGAFTSFRAAHPDVALTVLCSDDSVSLTRRDADVALRLSNAPPEHLFGRRVAQERFAVYASAALAAEIGLDAPLSAWPWLQWDERTEMARWLDGWLAEHAPGAPIAMRLDGSTRLLHEVVASGAGVHFLPCADGDPDSRVVRVGPELDSERRDVWVLTMPSLRANARVRAFMEHIAEAAVS